MRSITIFTASLGRHDAAPDNHPCYIPVSVILADFLTKGGKKTPPATLSAYGSRLKRNPSGLISSAYGAYRECILRHLTALVPHLAGEYS